MRIVLRDETKNTKLVPRFAFFPIIVFDSQTEHPKRVLIWFEPYLMLFKWNSNHLWWEHKNDYLPQAFKELNK